mgnify:CR=1 FL=1
MPRLEEPGALGMEREPQAGEIRREVVIDLEFRARFPYRRLVPQPFDDGARRVTLAARGVNAVGLTREGKPDMPIRLEPLREVGAELVRPAGEEGERAVALSDGLEFEGELDFQADLDTALTGACVSASSRWAMRSWRLMASMNSRCSAAVSS